MFGDGGVVAIDIGLAVVGAAGDAGLADGEAAANGALITVRGAAVLQAFDAQHAVDAAGDGVAAHDGAAQSGVGAGLQEHVAAGVDLGSRPGLISAFALAGAAAAGGSGVEAVAAVGAAQYRTDADGSALAAGVAAPFDGVLCGKQVDRAVGDERGVAARLHRGADEVERGIRARAGSADAD